MTFRIRLIARIAAALTLALLATYLVTCAVLDPRVEVSRDRVTDAMTAASDYMVGHMLDSGRFVYEVDGDGASTGDDYNVLRHAGAIYSLATYEELQPSPVLREAVLRAARYLRDRHVDAIADLPGRRTVFSLSPEEERRSRTAKLGGAGLGMVALLRARALDETLISVDMLREIAEFILFMQRPDGSFRSKYSEREQFADDFDSLYYPGQAILALSELYQVDPDPRWLEAALRATRSLIDRQRALDELPPDHWLMIAMAELGTVIDRAVDPPVGRDELVAHAIALSFVMLDDQRWVALIPGRAGSYVADGRATPSSTRLEGLAATYLALPPEHPARPILRGSIERGVGFILACQETDGPNRGGIREALGRRFGSRNWSHIRIDYPQHALSALIGWWQIAAAADPTT